MTITKGDSLGDRMKGYEAIPKTFLMRRTPVIIRIDGRAFHTFTKCLKQLDPVLAVTPFSDIMHASMVYTTTKLVESIQNCVLGYTQSDEISLLLRDWDQHETQQWFGGNVQKITSISASIATAAFNMVFSRFKTPAEFKDLAQFDARVYNVPKDEVTNYMIWRQQDASRNSVQMLGHFHFTQKEMHAKNNIEVQDMLMLQKGINWNDMPTWAKRGMCVNRLSDVEEGGKIVVDEEIPIFTQDRTYIERQLIVPQ